MFPKLARSAMLNGDVMPTSCCIRCISSTLRLRTSNQSESSVGDSGAESSGLLLGEKTTLTALRFGPCRRKDDKAGLEISFILEAA